MRRFYQWIRPGLFLLEEERAHAWCLKALQYWPISAIQSHPAQAVTTMGLHFPHPIGLAAGFDKTGVHLSALAKLGFSFIEVGTITPRPQQGHPKPRLYRIPAAQALINRMGFNNPGVEALVKTLQQTHYRGILGINIGKNKETPLSEAATDYERCLEKVYPYASYVTVNLSSPNTADLRLLQQGAFFQSLMSRLCDRRACLADQFQRYVPLVVKVSPDETSETLKQLTDVMMSLGIDGLIATNTTTSHEGVQAYLPEGMSGGVSGRPLREKSTLCLAQLKAWVGDDLALIGVGGIDSPTVAREKQAAGAQLLQVYTGLIYQGPDLIRQLVECT